MSFRQCVGWLLLIHSVLAQANTADQNVVQDCADDQVCFREVPGVVCGDGTQSGFSVTYREQATDLFIYFKGGGACWDEKTCESNTVQTLTAEAQYEGPYFGTKRSGWFDLKSPNSPIAEGFNIVNIPYCTGDVFVGNRVIDHGKAGDPLVVHHVGYNNITLILKELKRRFPSPDRILFYGSSAGGLGVTWNIHQLRKEFPHAEVFTLNDGGLPFKPPYVDKAKVMDIYQRWGADKTNPVPTRERRSIDHLSADLIRYNQKNFPLVSYGYVSSYQDLIMSYFSRLLNAPSFTTAVRKTMISLADEEFSLADNYRVFYLDDWQHVYVGKDPASVKSEGVSYQEWAENMLNSPTDWKDVRPDTHWME